MALELLKGFKWDEAGAHRTLTVELTVAEAMCLMALNQDFGHLGAEIIGRREPFFSIQKKLHKALDRSG